MPGHRHPLSVAKSDAVGIRHGPSRHGEKRRVDGADRSVPYAPLSVKPDLAPGDSA